jgi:hypothetical protein
MSIDPTRAADIGTRGAAQPSEATHVRGAARADAPVRRDQVEISDEARALAASEATGDLPVAEARLAEVQARLAEGFYRQEDVVRDVAARILESGDL